LGGSWADAKPGAGEGRESSPGVIAFSRPLESTDVFMVNEDGSGEHKLATLRNRPSNLSFSPSGKKLAAITSGGDVKTELVVIDVASGKVTEMSGPSKSPSRTALNKAGLGVCEGRTCWATENVIYFTAAIKGQGVLKPVVAKMDISVPKVEIVVKNAKNPALSADGKKLAYIHLPANWLERPAGAWKLSDPGDLVVKDLVGGATKTIYAHSKNTPADRQNSRGYIFEAAFHPDGKHLMTCCSDEPDSELYYIDMEGEILAVPDVCGTSGRLKHPSFSPDGQNVAYDSECWDCSETLKDNSKPHQHHFSITPPMAGKFDGSKKHLGNGSYPAWRPPGTGGTTTGGGTGGGGAGTRSR
jgi:Tol biopolymer transport system component